MPPLRFPFLVLLLATFLETVAARPKKDVIYFLNGDRLTCEIVSVDRGYLYVKLEYGDGTISLNWLSVQRIESPQAFLVTDDAGATIAGAISTVPNAPTPTLAVNGIGGNRNLRRSQIVRVSQSERNFWRDLEGSVSGGLQFNQSDQQTQFNLAANTTYRRTQWGATVALASSFSGSLSNASDLRNEVKLGFEHTLPKPNLYATAFSYFLQSQPQQLNLRSIYGAGIARYFKDTNRARIRAFAGASWTREDYADSTTPTSQFNSAEAVLGGSFEFFRFKALSLTSTLISYPGITDFGRFRFDTNSSARWEIVNNLYWTVTVYSNYDSRPPRNTTKTDSGVSSNVSWTF